MPPIPKSDDLIKASEAAKILGCTEKHAKLLCRSDTIGGVVKIPSTENSSGFYYMVPRSEVAKYKSLKHKRGWPRGKKRTVK